MKSVVFIRHAKSSWKNPELIDLDRPLNQRGKRDLQNVGYLFKNEGIKPDLIICSNAVRAKTTAKSLAAQCGYQKEIVVNENLYFKGSSTIFRQINQLSESFEKIWIVFHNPDINEIAIDLLQANEDNIPTLGCVFTKSISPTWINWSINNTEIVRIVKPKNLLS
ncbi:MAG: histidine phosphatase family protein [Bacteroidia bacterium]